MQISQNCFLLEECSGYDLSVLVSSNYDPNYRLTRSVENTYIKSLFGYKPYTINETELRKMNDEFYKMQNKCRQYNISFTEDSHTDYKYRDKKKYRDEIITRTIDFSVTAKKRWEIVKKHIKVISEQNIMRAKAKCGSLYNTFVNSEAAEIIAQKLIDFCKEKLRECLQKYPNDTEFRFSFSCFETNLAVNDYTMRDGRHDLDISYESIGYGTLGHEQSEALKYVELERLTNAMRTEKDVSLIKVAIDDNIEPWRDPTKSVAIILYLNIDQRINDPHSFEKDRGLKSWT